MNKLTNEDFTNLNDIRINILKKRLASCDDIELLESLTIEHPELSYERYKRLLVLKGKAFREAQFVTIGQSGCSIVSLMVFNENDYATPFSKSILSSINKIKNMLESDFNVAFSFDNFDGASFELALYIAAYCLKYDRTIKDNIVFSGIINQDTIETPYFSKKQACVKKNKKRLIGNMSLQNALLESLNPKSLIIWASKEKPNTDLEPIIVGELPKRSWKNIISKTASKIVPNARLAFRCPATFAFGLAAKLGSNHSYTVLHYALGSYYDIEISRILKEVNENIELLEVDGVVNSKTINLTIHLASHQPSFAPVDGANILIKSKTIGNIAIESYVQITRQINNYINILRKQGAEYFNIVISAPVAIAFMLGWAVGKFLPASLWQYFTKDSQYYKVFDVNKL